MRLGRLQVNWNKPPKKVDRNLDLIHFHTFRDGTNAYTYRVEQLSKVSGRYLDQVKSTLNFMLQYSAGPEQVKAFANNIRETLKMGLDGKMDKTDSIVKAYEISGAMPKLQQYVDDLHKKQWHDLVQMFIVIDGESEAYFSPKYNKRKIELLEEESVEVQEVFFSFVDSLIQHFSSTYKEDLLASTLRERDLASLATSLTLLTNSQDMKSQSPDGEELELKNTAT